MAEHLATGITDPGSGAAGYAAPGQMLSRPRLLSRLAGAGGCRLILLVAPAGYGKTVLLRQWTQDMADAFPILWHTASEHDNDPGYLLAALAGAVELSMPVAEHLAAGSPAVGTDLAPAAEEAARSPSYALEGLLRRAAQRVGAGLWLVLDEAENLVAPRVWRALDTVLALPGFPVRFAIASRTAPDLAAVARLQAEECVLALDEADLRFSEDESAAFLAASGLSLAPGDLEWLMARSDGWPVVLRFLVQAGRKGAPANARQAMARISQGGPLLDYLAGQVLSSQPPHLQAFLRRTALLPYLHPALCNAYLDSTQAGAILAYVERSHLFVSRTGIRWSLLALSSFVSSVFAPRP